LFFTPAVFGLGSNLLESKIKSPDSPNSYLWLIHTGENVSAVINDDDNVNNRRVEASSAYDNSKLVWKSKKIFPQYELIMV